MAKTNTSNSTVGYAPSTYTVNLHDPFKFIDQFWYGTTATTNTITDHYPPYNIREIDEDTRVYELATAGFSREELSIKVDNRTLIISGESKDDVEGKYIHKGIATRKFSKTVTLWEYWEVKSADYSDGVLYVVLKREIPEEKKPRVIAIQ